MGDFAYSVHGDPSGQLSALSGGSTTQSASPGESCAPPGSAGGVSIGYHGPPPGSSHGLMQNGQAQDTHQRPLTANLWGYSVPSPPQASSSLIAVPGPHHTAGGNHVRNYQQPPPAGPPTAYNNAYHGFNTSNTRPMTAPSSSMNAPMSLHHGAYGPMFSPATYNGAGFPANLGGNRDAHPLYSSTPTIRKGVQNGRDYSVSTSANFSGETPRGHTGGSGVEIFAHQPPPLASSSRGHPYSQHQFAQYHERPGTDYAARRSLHDITEQYRPGTSDTVRPDTAISAYSDYSAAGFPLQGGGMGGMQSLHMQMQQPSYYGMADNGMGMLAQQNGHEVQPRPTTADQLNQQYSFIPLPTQPKKRPRRRFEEIERIYDCNYPGCNKAYGTLNHLNAHVSMQKHGPKRVPAEFKEVRKAWRQRKKDREAAAKIAAEGGEDEGDQGEESDEDEGDRQEGALRHSHSASDPSSAYFQQPRENLQANQKLSVTAEHQRNPYYSHHIPGDTSTPPSSTQFPSTSPTLVLHPAAEQVRHHSQYPDGDQHGSRGDVPIGGQYYSSPSYASRPSTAPSNFFHHSFGGSIAGPSISPSQASLSQQSPPQGGQHHYNHYHGTGASPMLGGLPPGVNPGMRRSSLTSLVPAFPSIAEEPSAEATAASGLEGEPQGSLQPNDGSDSLIDGDLGLFAQFDEHSRAYLPESETAPRPDLRQIPHRQENGYSASSPTLEARSLPDMLDAGRPPYHTAYPQVLHRRTEGSAPLHQQQLHHGAYAAQTNASNRPHTASSSSPFRYSANGHAEGGSDKPEQRCKTMVSPNGGSSLHQFHQYQQQHPQHEVNGGSIDVPVGHAGSEFVNPSGITQVLDVTGRWSPSWSNMAGQPYKQEIR